MKRSTIELEIPNDVFERAKDIASGGNRSIESVLREGLVMVFGTTEDCGASMESLQDFSDEKLWEVIHLRLSFEQDRRVRQLMALGREGKLRPQEESEFDDLLALIDHQTLLRSKALALLKERGHDVLQYLNVQVVAD